MQLYAVINKPYYYKIYSQVIVKNKTLLMICPLRFYGCRDVALLRLPTVAGKTNQSKFMQSSSCTPPKKHTIAGEFPEIKPDSYSFYFWGICFKQDYANIILKAEQRFWAHKQMNATTIKRNWYDANQSYLSASLALVRYFIEIYIA